MVVADAVARHGGIPELIPKTEDMQEEKGREKNRWEINKKGAVIELKKTTKMTLCANPYTLYNSCTPRDSSGINHKRQRKESPRYVKGIRQNKEQDCRVGRKTDASTQSRNRRKALNSLRNSGCGSGRCGLP